MKTFGIKIYLALTLLLFANPLSFAASSPESATSTPESGKFEEAGHEMKEGFKTTGHGIKEGSKTAGHEIKKGGKAAGRGFKKAGHKIHDAFTQ